MYHHVKRFLDLILSFLAAIIFLPLFIIIMIAIKADSKGPALFRQKRIGRYEKQFYILKFRTMKCDAPKDIPTHLIENPECYITRVGKFLRNTSLDELPQLYNIIKGQMSIVGPRPALWNQYDLIEERKKYRANEIRPGLTGWAQINGRDGLLISEKAKLDGEYIQNISFWFDIRCILGTVTSVIKHKNIIEGGTGKTNIS